MKKHKWIGWEGIGVPRFWGCRVVFMLRNGTIDNQYSDNLRWWHVGDIEPSLYSNDYDIVAYRLAD